MIEIRGHANEALATQGARRSSVLGPSLGQTPAIALEAQARQADLVEGIGCQIDTLQGLLERVLQTMDRLVTESVIANTRRAELLGELRMIRRFGFGTDNRNTSNSGGGDAGDEDDSVLGSPTI